MPIAIEQLIKMFDPRSVSAECLHLIRAVPGITREQILGAFAAVAQRHPLGFDLLLARYREDRQAEQRARRAAADRVRRSPHPLYGTAVCQLAVTVALGRTLPAQQVVLAALLRKHGPRAMLAAKQLADIQCQQKGLEKARVMLSEGDWRYQRNLAQHDALVGRSVALRRALADWADAEAARSPHCPRCRGSGQLLRPQPHCCDTCGGRGKISVTAEHFRRSLADEGIVITPERWRAEYQPWVHDTLSRLYQEMQLAGDALSIRLTLEGQAVA
ncbi:TIGR02642 family protein [Edwardsiella tarda]|uniref:TIGR02642 family protein n=1 Tax=Edwardsiella tarda TaxID=636 RepID=UPI00098FC157|nr:TIGR02642 family protein [Edwardsiella tarda]